MLSYVARRLLWGAAVLFLVVFVTFLVFYVLPSADPAKQRAKKGATPAQIEALREQQGLDEPFHEQFWVYARDLVTELDLGRSRTTNTPVRDRVLERVEPTVLLAGGAAVIWLALALVVGTVSAIKRGTLVDRAAMGAALLAVSAPVYWLGLVSLYLFSEELGWLPVFKGQGAYDQAETLAGRLEALILPWLVLAASFAAIYARVLRAQLIEAMDEDYIRTARAKGLSERRVVLKHGLRGAATPIVTLFGIDLGVLLGGALLTEIVFNIPGLGRESYNAIIEGDLPVVQATVILSAGAIILLNLIVDLLYAAIDPRVRHA